MDNGLPDPHPDIHCSGLNQVMLVPARIGRTSTFVVMVFSGWPEEVLDFYEGLIADNSKTYWTAHKPVYDGKIHRPMAELTEELAAEFGEPKIFRPYRDVRFSADKTPYKTTLARRSATCCTSSSPRRHRRGSGHVADGPGPACPLP